MFLFNVTYKSYEHSTPETYRIVARNASQAIEGMLAEYGKRNYRSKPHVVTAVELVFKIDRVVK